MYKAAVVGAGRIGAGFDSPDNGDTLTHTKALLKHDRVSDIVLVDCAQDRLREETTKWGVPGYKSLNAMLEAVRPDIVSVCVPTEQHAAVLRKLHEVAIPVIIAEKPLTDDLQESKKIVELFEHSKTALVVNYTRRWDAALVEMRKRYLSGELGRFLHGSGLYTRGVLNNGSHLIDLFQWVLGEPKGLRKTREFVDHDPSDPNVEFVLEFDQAAVHIGCGVGKLYHVFEYAFYFENEAFRWDTLGRRMHHYQVGEYPTFAGRPDLKHLEVSSSGLPEAMKRLVDNVVGYLDSGETLNCLALETLKSHEISLELINGQ